VLGAALLVLALGGAAPRLRASLDNVAALSAPVGAAHADPLADLVVRPERGSRSMPSAASVAPPPAPGDTVIAPPPAAFEADVALPPPVPPQELLAAEVPDAVDGTGVWAVIIGVNDYPGASADLRSAVNDADDMDEALARLGVPAERRLVLRDRDATAETIGLAADWLVARAGPDATAVFFYAGHVRKTLRGNEAIVAADGELVDDETLAWRLAPLQAKAWIVMASCFGGGFTEVLGPGRLLTAAADADNLAYENSGFGRSYLVQYMVRQGLIERNAPTTAQGAFAYADTALRRDYPNRVPFQADLTDGPIELSMPAVPVAPAVPGAGDPGGAAPSGPTQGPAPAPAAPASPPGGQPSGGPGRNDPPPRPEDDKGQCAGLRLGVVTCGP
jgi:hypothetical protein